MGSGASKDKTPPYPQKTARYMEPASSTDVTDISSAIPSISDPYGTDRDPRPGNDCYEVARRIDYIKNELSKGRYNIDLQKLDQSKLNKDAKDANNMQTLTEEPTEPLGK
ncbi:ganglioside biosynthetic process [Branchiostoma belcheri]|nr:ganglioside biosynthetic process [Branchiostoma belcheri]